MASGVLGWYLRKIYQILLTKAPIKSSHSLLLDAESLDGQAKRYLFGLSCQVVYLFFTICGFFKFGMVPVERDLLILLLVEYPANPASHCDLTSMMET